ncbi:MAG: hypothetical protein AB8A49_04745 [Prochlorococcus sp.]
MADATSKEISETKARERKLGIAVSISVFALNALLILIVVLDRTVPSVHQSLMGILAWINSW